MLVFPENKIILLFDGVCNLCNSSVQTIIENDQKDIFRFVALQSHLGQEIVKHIGLHPMQIDSIIFYKPGKCYTIKSEAVLCIAKELGGWYNLLSLFSIIPTKVLDFIYDIVAKNRYKWFGKKTTCIIPSVSIQNKFLS